MQVPFGSFNEGAETMPPNNTIITRSLQNKTCERRHMVTNNLSNVFRDVTSNRGKIWTVTWRQIISNYIMTSIYLISTQSNIVLDLETAMCGNFIFSNFQNFDLRRKKIENIWEKSSSPQP